MKKARPQSPIFAKTYDFLLWLIPLTLKFPRSQRFLLAERLSGMALDFYDHILEAVLEPAEKDRHLRAAAKLLEKVRLYLRLSSDLQCISLAQMEHAARQVDELGQLLGGWQRKAKEAPGATQSGRLAAAI